MNTMPGFAAEASIYKTSGRYQSVANRGDSSGDQRVVSQIRVGGLGGLGGSGGLNAWHCWTPSCCVAGHYEAGPAGWYWVCDLTADCPYQYCVWLPW